MHRIFKIFKFKERCFEDFDCWQLKEYKNQDSSFTHVCGMVFDSFPPSKIVIWQRKYFSLNCAERHYCAVVRNLHLARFCRCFSIENTPVKTSVLRFLSCSICSFIFLQLFHSGMLASQDAAAKSGERPILLRNNEVRPCCHTVNKFLLFVVYVLLRAVYPIPGLRLPSIRRRSAHEGRGSQFSFSLVVSQFIPYFPAQKHM